MTLFQLQRNLQGFSLPEQIQEVIQETSPEIVRLNQGQMMTGVTKLGGPITNRFKNRTYYGVQWGEYRHSLGLQTEFYDLRVTGDFQESIEVDDISQKTFTIDATNAKTSAIEEMFGDSILGLSDESKAEYVPKVFFPALKERIIAKTGLRFR